MDDFFLLLGDREGENSVILKLLAILLANSYFLSFLLSFYSLRELSQI